MKSVITFDIDGVVFDTNRLAAEIITSHGLTPRFDDWNFSWLPKNIRSDVYKTYYGEDIKRGPLTSEMLPIYIHILSQDYDIYFVSARPAILLDATIEQFARNGIDITREQLILLDNSNKADVLQDLETVLHIDDSDTVIRSCLKYNLNHCMISNEMTGYNHYLRKSPDVRWAKNLDNFWENRNTFIEYPLAKNGIRQRS
jgi:FMN phosphatase YigB (HAD superfamily)